MKIAKIVFIIVWIWGALTVVIGMFDLMGGSRPENLLAGFIALLVGIGGHVWVSKRLKESK